MARRGREIDELLHAAAEARAGLPDEYRADDQPFAAADARTVYDELVRHAAPGRTFLEWGSGIGTVTLLADRLGFAACGIELDALLLDSARQLAARCGSGARFVHGNFVPLSERPRIAAERVSPPFALDGADAYKVLGKSPGDFDLIYVFPWPDHIDLCHDLFARCARSGARLLIYSQTMDVLEAVKTESGCSPLRPA